jgi:hypothetical protein
MGDAEALLDHSSMAARVFLVRAKERTKCSSARVMAT